MKLKVLCDGGRTFGIGHLRRAATVAASLQKIGFEVGVEALSDEGATILHRFLDVSLRVSSEMKADLTVIDVPTDMDNLIRKISGKVVTLDYFGAVPHHLSIFVFPHSAPPPAEHVFGGPEYILIREDLRPFRPAEVSELDYSSEKQVLVLLGGADILRQSKSVAKKLSGLGCNVTLVRAIENLNSMDNVLESEDPRIEELIRPIDLPSIMSQSDWAIVNGGGSLFEMIYLGKPVIVLPQTPAEARIADWANAAGAILDIGEEKVRIPNVEERRKAGVAAFRLIDGNGADRIAQKIKEFA